MQPLAVSYFIIHEHGVLVFLFVPMKVLPEPSERQQLTTPCSSCIYKLNCCESGVSGCNDNMGNYINSSLVKGERVVYEAHYHWTVWVMPVFFNVIFTLPILLIYSESIANGYEYSSGVPGFVWIFPLLGVLLLILTYAKVVTDEFAVTTQRLIIKTGVISRTTLELNLRKVETVSVSQGLLDRIFGGGTLECRGTGSTLSRISNIKEPYEFRKAFQNALDRYSSDNVDIEEPSAKPVNVSSVQPIQASTASSISSGKAEKLIQLKELLDTGILTQEEFDSEKKKILNS